MKNYQAAQEILALFTYYTNKAGYSETKSEATVKAIAELMTFPMIDTFIEEKYVETNEQMNSGYGLTIPIIEDTTNINTTAAKEMTEEDFDIYRRTATPKPGEIAIIVQRSKNK